WSAEAKLSVRMTWLPVARPIRIDDGDSSSLTSAPPASRTSSHSRCVSPIPRQDSQRIQRQVTTMTVPDRLARPGGVLWRIASNPVMDAHTDVTAIRRVLLVTTTAGYRHQSIPTVWRALPQIAYGAGGLAVGTILEDVPSLERLTPELLAAHQVLCLVH